MNTLAYKPSTAEVLQRLRLLHQRRAQDRIFAVMHTPNATLAEFCAQNPGGYCDYPDPAARIEFWDRLLQQRTALEDDSIPSAYLSEMDQGLYGGLLGGDVQFLCHPETGWISSMVKPLLADWSGFDVLRFDRSHPWFQRYLRQLDIFLERADGNFGISHFILINGLNFVFELVGATNTYLSLVEHPEMVRRAVRLALELNVEIHRTFFQRVPDLDGGTCSNVAQWVPGHIVSESVDPFHMTSVDYFERWGREPVQQVFEQFDGGLLHLHSNGRHLVEAVCSVKGLKAVRFQDEPQLPPAFDVLDQLKARAGEMPLVVEARFEPFVEKLRRQQLPGGVLYQVHDVPDVDSANRRMDQVRAYRV